MLLDAIAREYMFVGLFKEKGMCSRGIFDREEGDLCLGGLCLKGGRFVLERFFW